MLTVAGSSQGLGKALVEVLLAADERVVATLRKPEALGSLSKKHPASQVLVLPLDVTNEAQISEAFEMTRERFGRLDVVVNNAGYCVEGEIEAVPEEVARKEMDVLFWGLVHITKQVCSIQRHMPGLTFIQPVGHKDVNPPGHGGRILDISSVGGYRAWPGSNYYHAGKFGKLLSYVLHALFLFLIQFRSTRSVHGKIHEDAARMEHQESHN